jgi:hypothetical protein
MLPVPSPNAFVHKAGEEALHRVTDNGKKAQLLQLQFSPKSVGQSETKFGHIPVEFIQVTAKSMEEF